jgi:hypothetical protein
VIESIALRVALAIGAVMVVAGAGWQVRGWKADSDMAAYQQKQRQTVAAQDQQVKAVEAVDTRNTQASTARLDVDEPQRAVEVRYVTQEVIKYKDRPVAGRCVLPVDWVRLYNAAGTGATGELPDAAPTGPAPARAASGVSAVAGTSRQ